MPESSAKGKIKVVVSSVVWAFDQALGLVGRSKPNRSNGVVLLYHDVLDHQVEAFSRHVAFLRAHYDVAPLTDLHASSRRSSRLRVALTFDDALESFGANAVAVLSKDATPATLFVPSGLISSLQPGYMTPEAVKNLPPFIEVGSHSRMHRRLSDLAADELQQEVAGSRNELEQMTGRPVTSFAFPFGDTNVSVEKCTTESGYERSYSVRPGTVGDERHSVPRTTLEPTDSLFELRLKAEGAYRWMGALMAARRRFLGHNV